VVLVVDVDNHVRTGGANAEAKGECHHVKNNTVNRGAVCMLKRVVLMVVVDQEKSVLV
jgi:hypothetical protein